MHQNENHQIRQIAECTKSICKLKNSFKQNFQEIHTKTQVHQGTDLASISITHRPSQNQQLKFTYCFKLKPVTCIADISIGNLYLIKL